MDITGDFGNIASVNGSNITTNGAFYNQKLGNLGRGNDRDPYHRIYFQASRSWTGSTSSASPYTEVLGSGTAISIQPSYITLKFWKRLT